jgi:hypothetical protein
MKDWLPLLGASQAVKAEAADLNSSFVPLALDVLVILTATGLVLFRFWAAGQIGLMIFSTGERRSRLAGTNLPSPLKQYRPCEYHPSQ